MNFRGWILINQDLLQHLKAFGIHKDGTQIDLIIERKDNVVNMCEIKFYGNDFYVNKEYHKILINRQQILSKELSPKMIIHNTLITTYGLKYNEYGSDFDNVITLDDIFVL